jgi:hypothetical protein
MNEQEEISSLSLRCAQRLSHFTRYTFDPTSDESWATADKLWRAARLAMDAERVLEQAQS